MSTESLLGLLFMLAAVVFMGAEFRFQSQTEDRIITSAKCVTLFIFYLGTLLLAPAVVAYLPTFTHPGITNIIVYGAATVIFGILATVFASRLWFEMLVLLNRIGRLFKKFDKSYKKIILSDP